MMNLASFFITLFIVFFSIGGYIIVGIFYPQNEQLILWLTLFASSIKTILFVSNVMQKKLDIFEINSLTPNKHRIFVILAILLILFSYSSDLTFIQFISPIHFEGIDTNLPLAELFFKMFFYTSHFFFWMGVVHIYPKSFPAEYITLMISTTTFITLAFSTLRFITHKKNGT